MISQLAHRPTSVFCQSSSSSWEPDTSAPKIGTEVSGQLDTSAPNLSRIIGGAVSRRYCPGSGVSRLFLDPVPKCIKTVRHWCRNVSCHVFCRSDFGTTAEVTSAPVPKCLVAEVSGNRHHRRHRRRQCQRRIYGGGGLCLLPPLKVKKLY